MTITLDAFEETLVNERLTSGSYSDAHEVIREALMIQKEREIWPTLTTEQLRAEIQIGLDQLARGESMPFDAEEIIRLSRTDPRDAYAGG